MKGLFATALMILALGIFSDLATAATESVAKIDRFIASTWHMQKVMHAPLTPTNYSYRRTHSDKYRDWVRRYWRGVNRQTQSRYFSVPYESAWQCIHRYEGSWQDDGAPYYGGLQMDLGFQRAYGGYLLALKGTANGWTPTEQMWVAYYAFRSGRGFNPWPNTARMCRLI